MIAANELRPGNFLTRAGHWVIVDGQTIRDVSSVPGAAERYEGIPLSRAVLDRCGFRDGSIRVSNDVGWAFRLELDSGELVLAVKEYALPVNCKYLHQLQNLYYAITGDELPVTAI
jgi:hypothetical protein